MDFVRGETGRAFTDWMRNSCGFGKVFWTVRQRRGIEWKSGGEGAEIEIGY